MLLKIFCRERRNFLSDTRGINNMHQHIYSFIATQTSWVLSTVKCRVVARGGEAGLRAMESLTVVTQKLKPGQGAFSGDMQSR